MSVMEVVKRCNMVVQRYYISLITGRLYRKSLFRLYISAVKFFKKRLYGQKQRGLKHTNYFISLYLCEFQYSWIKNSVPMKNKTWTYLVVVSAALLMAGCGSRTKKQTNEDVSMDSVTVACSGVKTLQLEGMRVTWIQDNAVERLMPRTIFPDASDELVESLSLQGGIPSSMSAFLVEANGIRILFDTGMGASDSRLLPGLQSLGISPADIGYLYLTHFHNDHIGGMMKGDSVVFPNAEVYVSKVEYDAWMAMPAERKAQVVKRMDAYKERLHLFEFGDTLPGNVVAMEAVGHTPGHTVFQSGRLLVIGDLIHGAALQLEHPEYCASYDTDKEAAVKVRKHFLQYAKDNQLTMAGMHLPAPAFK